MKVLHTADFEAREGEFLVVAGDIFDHGQPSAEALRTYYRFRGGLQGTCCRQVVVVAGNHDSAAGLEVLDAVGVHVVGG
jgi:exonuclease SbcD